MIEKLNKFDLDASELEKLKAFQSRDGFVLVEDTEFDELQNYFDQFPIFKNIVAFLTDENSNYWCLYVDGPMKGMVCYLNNEEHNLEPRFKNISGFLKVIDENPEACDFDELDEALFDFPSNQNLSEFTERKQIIEQLKTNFISEIDDDVKQQIAFSIIALTSNNEIESNVYPLLDDEDMYVQERAIQILGFHRYTPARETLIDLKTTAMPNGRISAEIALKKLRAK